jgi:hypothetical protein
MTGNRWLIARGKGPAGVHRIGVHGGPDPHVVGIAAVAGLIFGAAVLIAETISS